jgi:hypothetical protein
MQYWSARLARKQMGGYRSCRKQGEFPKGAISRAGAAALLNYSNSQIFCLRARQNSGRKVRVGTSQPELILQSLNRSSGAGGSLPALGPLVRESGNRSFYASTSAEPALIAESTRVRLFARPAIVLWQYEMHFLIYVHVCVLATSIEVCGWIARGIPACDTMCARRRHAAHARAGTRVYPRSSRESPFVDLPLATGTCRSWRAAQCAMSHICESHGTARRVTVSAARARPTAAATAPRTPQVGPHHRQQQTSTSSAVARVLELYTPTLP